MNVVSMEFTTKFSRPLPRKTQSLWTSKIQILKCLSLGNLVTSMKMYVQHSTTIGVPIQPPELTVGWTSMIQDRLRTGG